MEERDLKKKKKMLRKDKYALSTGDLRDLLCIGTVLGNVL